MDILTHINEVFSEAVFSKYKKKRYGLKTCSTLVDEELADDLRVLYIRTKEMTDCGCTLSGACSLKKIEEKINTI